MAEESNIKQEYNIARAGMNLDNSVNQIPKGQISYGLNAVVENWDSNSTSYQNEQGNEPCGDFAFPEGYQVIGNHFIVEQGKHIFFLVGGQNSEIGYMNNNDCVYHTYINSTCLNFNINYPIQKSVHKITNCTTEIYWTDGLNPRRYLDLNNIPYLTIPGSDICNATPTSEIDCNKLNIQPNFSIPGVSVTDIISGGANIAGTYQFAIQYSDAIGDGYTSYYSVTNPTPIANPQLTTADFNYPVGKSIVLDIDNIDITGYFKYFNVAVIKTINAITSVELIGTYFIDGESKQIIYSGQNVSQIRLVIGDIFEKFPYYEIADDLTAVQDILVWKGLSSNDRISYQAIANNIHLQWETWQIPSTENYADELNATNLRGYLRDEIYPFEIVFLLNNGKQTDGFHIPGRAINNTDTSHPDVPNTNPDFIGEGTSAPYWKIYNTGSVLGTDPGYSTSDSYKGPYQYGDFAYWESTERYPCNTAVWGDLADQPIRHHKFPDALISPIFKSGVPSVNGDGTYFGLTMDSRPIFPIGVKVDVQDIERLVLSSSLTSAQKEKIVGFKIVRGDRNTNKSIISKGILRNVGKYTRDGTDFYFPNYPYNDLTIDPFLLEANNNDGVFPPNLDAFSTDGSKYRQVFNSPETSFGQPYLGDVLKLENVVYGTGKAHFVEVKNNALYKLLSKEAQEDALHDSELLGNITTPFNATAMFTAYQSYLQIYINGITRKNYGYSYNSIATYGYSADIDNGLGNKQRRLDISQYLIPGVQSLGDDLNINNWERESSIYLKTTSSYVPLPFPSQTPSLIVGPISAIEDRSRYIKSQQMCDAPENQFDITSVCYYAAIKNVFLNQWGQMYSYDTIDTGFQHMFSENLSTVTMFGGDTFINKFSFKTKLPFFIDNRVNAPDDSDIFYDEIGNVAYPQYWHSARSILYDYVGVYSGTLKNIISIKAHHLDCPNVQVGEGRTYYDGNMYMFAYGIPTFYCESSINVDLRQAYNNKEGDFYPHVSTGIPDSWLQETNVSIALDNTYYYNVTYSKQNKENYFSHLPVNWTFDDCLTNFPFRAIHSDPQQSFTDNTINSWLIYRPASFFDFPQNYGNFTSIDGIENKQVLARFDNKSLLYNVLYTNTVNTGGQVYLGQPLFSKNTIPLDFAETDLGYVGSQHKFLLKIPQGQITVDAKRGQIFLVSNSAVKDLSAFGSGMNRFLTDHLAFEILQYFQIDVDNHFKGLGLHGVYDSKFDRVIISKLDYIPLSDSVLYDAAQQQFYVVRYVGEVPIRTDVYLSDPNYFCNKSWTLSFNLNTMSWISFHSYIPNWYIAENNFFYSGISEGCSLNAIAGVVVNCSLAGEADYISGAECELGGEAIEQ